MQLLQVRNFCSNCCKIHIKTGRDQCPSPAAVELFLDDFQNTHRAGLGADAAGDALGGGTLSRLNHNLHGANLYALAAGGTQLLIDHVHTGLGVLSDCTGLTDLHALATLNADIGLSTVALGNDTDAGQILVKFFIKCFGASTNAL